MVAVFDSPMMSCSWTTFARGTWSRWAALSGRGKSRWTPSTPQVSTGGLPGRSGSQEKKPQHALPACSLGLAALHEAVLSGNLECVKLLVKHGANIQQRDETGWTALHIACSDGYPDIARYKGLNPNLPAPGGL